MKEQLQTPDLWLEANVEEIYRLMRDFHLLLLRDDPKDPELDLSQRSLSEMPLCKVNRKIMKKIGLPVGYSVANGWVDRLYEGVEPKGNFHVFLKNEGNDVMDFTFGQFAVSGSEPGARIGAFQRVNPGLVRTFSNGLAVLQGNVAEISRSFGLGYEHQRLRPSDLVFATI